jgi:DNA ligase-associated metallophosphoesterase
MIPRHPDGSVSIAIQGETLWLMPQRVAYWVGARTLLVADVHFGKAAAFRALGVAVPEGTTGAALERLDAALHATNAMRVVFLGDFLHAREGRAPTTLEAVRAWRARWARVEMLLVRGNHDRGAGDPPPDADIRCADAPVVEPPFALAHHPAESRQGFVLAGHLHPGALLRGAARQRARLPCFWARRGGLVLPAFGDFTGLAEIEPAPGDRVFVVADGDVVEVGHAAPDHPGGMRKNSIKG